MRQRVMIAMALACKPKLLIADEPTTALDVTIQAQILELIKSLQDEEGMSVLFITHDMGVVAEIADRVVVMFDGEAVEAGARRRHLRRARAQPYTRALLAAVPRLGSMTGRQRADALSGRRRATGDVGARRRDAGYGRRAPSGRCSKSRNLTTRFDVRSGLFGRVSGARARRRERLVQPRMRGETLALVGESGCGKSTTGRSLLRLIEPLGGSILFEGEDMRRSPARAARAPRAIQMIFQDPFASLDPRMTVGAAIAEPLFVHGLAARREARETRRRAPASTSGCRPTWRSRFPHEFSGGQRQRICIARALALGAEAHRRGRGGVGARRLDQGADRQPDARPAGEIGPRLSVHLARHGGRRARQPSRRRDVSRRDRRDRAARAIFDNPQHPYTRRLLAAVPVPDPARRGTRHRVADGDIKSPSGHLTTSRRSACTGRGIAGPCRPGLGRGVDDPMLAKDLWGALLS